jgi:hypothetical protein
MNGKAGDGAWDTHPAMNLLDHQGPVNFEDKGGFDGKG